MSHTWRVRALGVAGAVLMLAALAALLSLRPPGGPQGVFDVFVLATRPVEPGDSVVVCPVAFDSRFEPLADAVTVRLTTDRVYYEESTVPANTCRAVRVRRVVTNQLWVEACYMGVCAEKTVQAAGPIMLATTDVINILLALNLVQFAVIVFLVLRMQGRV